MQALSSVLPFYFLFLSFCRYSRESGNPLCGLTFNESSNHKRYWLKNNGQSKPVSPRSKWIPACSGMTDRA
jgi:hypothetical protein